MHLSHDFFYQPTLHVAQKLIGTTLVFHNPEGSRELVVTETEAYIGTDDQASHARRGRTPRTELMFGPPGYTYVYLVYGIHHCLNIVTEEEGMPAAVLIRAGRPMKNLTLSEEEINGPGRLTRWLGITRAHNGIDATGKLLYSKREHVVRPKDILSTPRIGVDYAGEWAKKLWRFRIKDGASIRHTTKTEGNAR